MLKIIALTFFEWCDIFGYVINLSWFNSTIPKLEGKDFVYFSVKMLISSAAMTVCFQDVVQNCTSFEFN